MYRLNGVTAVLEGRTRHDPVLGMMAGKFTLVHYDPRSNGDQPRMLCLYADMANGK